MPFTVEVPEFVIQASQRYSESVKMGKRGDGSDGTAEQQLVGVIGQNMVNMALCTPFMQRDTGFDGGFDFELFGLRIDVKTMGRTTPPRGDYVNNLLRSQIKFDCNIYLFLSFNKTNNYLTFCGWITKESLLYRAKLYRKDEIRERSDGSSFSLKADTLEIENKQLNHSFRSWPQLIVALHQHTTDLF
jgi:hypothetical protein